MKREWENVQRIEDARAWGIVASTVKAGNPGGVRSSDFFPFLAEEQGVDTDLVLSWFGEETSESEPRGEG